MQGNELIIFSEEEFGQIRIFIKEDNPWFVALDVCNILNLGNVSLSVNGRPDRSDSGLDDDEKDIVIVNTPGGEQEMLIVSEAGLYSLVLKSRKPEAKKFKRWITHTLLPTIRKTGGYVANEDLFINIYLPFADNPTKNLFKATLTVIKNQNQIIQKQQKEIEYKEDVIIGLVDQISLAEKRQILNRVVRRCTNYQDRWNELYRQFEMKYSIGLSARLKSYNLEHKIKLKNKLDYIDKVLNKIPELYEIAVKLYESEVKELVNELYALRQKEKLA